MLEFSNVSQWVEDAEGGEALEFRQAVHTALASIASDPHLKKCMIFKGGMLLAVRYHSERFTKDIDFSTEQDLSTVSPEDVELRLNQSLALIVEELGYGLDCRVQSIKRLPKNQDKPSTPSLAIKIGFAYKGTNKHHRLMKGQSPSAISIDYSLSECTPNIESFSLGDGEEILIYSLVDLIAEKFRSLLQQVSRDRYRRQDVYDLNAILNSLDQFDPLDKNEILSSLKLKSEARQLQVDQNSLSNPEVKSRAEKEYHTLRDEIDSELPDFESSFELINEYYQSLPWSKARN